MPTGGAGAARAGTAGAWAPSAGALYGAWGIGGAGGGLTAAGGPLPWGGGCEYRPADGGTALCDFGGAEAGRDGCPDGELGCGGGAGDKACSVPGGGVGFIAWIIDDETRPCPA